MSRTEYWDTFWTSYLTNHPTENMNPGEQYSAACHEFRKGLTDQVMLLHIARIDRHQAPLYLTNMQRLLGVIIDVAKRMNREDPDHPAVINRGVDHWDSEFGRLCDERIMDPLIRVFDELDGEHGGSIDVRGHGSDDVPSGETDFHVAGFLQGIQSVANILLSDDELPEDFGYVDYGFPPDHMRLSDELPSSLV
ncbi:uncharacterized protein N7529_009576 [Penicillium soppii]|uniref:uncharacterized protein n=1 Tax=Penicillium soppii TaxID=69789 RepID=UPI0025485772|nr:uncharacterized protein N7529_009576 [Penicillium soppii]KAJ5855632.1 hypothetical protein N7529_009576 [Penicillium soppii]